MKRLKANRFDEEYFDDELYMDYESYLERQDSAGHLNGKPTKPVKFKIEAVLDGQTYVSSDDSWNVTKSQSNDMEVIASYLEESLSDFYHDKIKKEYKNKKLSFETMIKFENFIKETVLPRLVTKLEAKVKKARDYTYAEIVFDTDDISLSIEYMYYNSDLTKVF